MKLPIERSPSLALTLVLTCSAWVLLGASVIIMTVESLISMLSPQDSSSKTGNWRKNMMNAKLFPQDEFVQEASGMEN